MGENNKYMGSAVQTGILLFLALFLSTIIFITDLKAPLGIAVGAMYCIVILYSWLFPWRFGSVYAGIFCSALVMLAFNISPDPNLRFQDAAINRIISLIVIWVCASLVMIAKRSFEGLEKAKMGLEDKVENRTKELVASRRKFRRLLESAPDAMVMVNGEGEIQLVNTQVKNIFGYDPEELLGKKVEVLIPERYRGDHYKHRNGFFGSAHMRPMGASLELWGIRKNKKEFPVEISLSPIETEEGTLVTAAIRDISDRKKAEIALRNKNKELEQFVYIASHDLQEPLRTMISYAELLEKRYKEKLDDDAGIYLRFVTEASERMSDLVKSLLDYGRIGRSDQMVIVDCNEILKDLQADLNALLTETNTKLEIEKLPILKAYKAELRLLFQNLLSNGIKFCKLGTTPLIRVSARDMGGEWIFKVEDNGIGIKKEHHERIFVIFQRLHQRKQYEGMGVGLAHCRKIVDLHGGNIWVESKPDEGAVFCFSIPS